MSHTPAPICPCGCGLREPVWRRPNAPLEMVPAPMWRPPTGVTCPCGSPLHTAHEHPLEPPADVDGWRMETIGGLPELHLGPRTRLVIGTLSATGLLAGIVSTVAGIPYLEALGWVGILLAELVVLVFTALLIDG